MINCWNNDTYNNQLKIVVVLFVGLCIGVTDPYIWFIWNKALYFCFCGFYFFLSVNNRNEGIELIVCLLCCVIFVQQKFTRLSKQIDDHNTWQYNPCLIKTALWSWPVLSYNYLLQMKSSVWRYWKMFNF